MPVLGRLEQQPRVRGEAGLVDTERRVHLSHRGEGGPGPRQGHAACAPSRGSEGTGPARRAVPVRESEICERPWTRAGARPLHHVAAGQAPTIGELLDRQGLLAYVLLLPGLLILILFIGYPFVTSLWLAVTDQSVSTSVARFIGLDNFTDELRSQIFLQTVRNTFMY